MVKQTKEELARGKEHWDWLNRNFPTGKAEQDQKAANGRGDLLFWMLLIGGIWAVVANWGTWFG